MRVYAVIKSYGKDDIEYYQVLPYSLSGTILCHFKYLQGFKSLILFLKDCRLTEQGANRLKHKYERR